MVAARQDSVTAFARDVVEGRTLACRWVKLACERHLRDLKDLRFLWDWPEASRRIDLFSTMRHYKGAFRGKPFVLSDWEEFIIGSLFGWKARDSVRRRFWYAFVKVPRKNGKTLLAAGVGINLLLYGANLGQDGRLKPEAGAEVYFLATKEDQARLGWRDCSKVIKRSPGYSDRLSVRINEIRYEAEDGLCRALGADSNTLDGLNPHGAICDEFHAWENRDLYDVIEDALGARDQPMIFIITTEGVVRDNIHDEIDKHAKSILQSDGSYSDDKFFAMIYEPDEGDDPFEEKTWFKVNPELGKGKSLEYMRDQAAKARLMPGKRSTFLTKQLNIRTNAVNLWISIDLWDACKGVVKESELAAIPGCAGLDLARSGDTTAFVGVFPDGDKGFSLVPRFWIPEAKLDDMTDRVMARTWRRWADEGFVKVTDGNVTDFRVVEADIAELTKKFQITEMGYDPNFATDLALRLRDDHGVNVVEFTQNYKNYALPCAEFERLLACGKLHHGGHPILRWNAGNAVVREGPSGNKMPDKAKAKKRIDGIAALLMGLGRVLTTPATTGPGLFFQESKPSTQ